jgi:probable HAF family extracellular repeat protein
MKEAVMRPWLFVPALGLACAITTATAQTYTVTNLGLLPNYPYGATSPAGINDAGQVTGASISLFVGPPGVPVPEAFLYTDGEMVALSGENSYGYAITGGPRETAGHGDEEKRKLRVVGEAQFTPLAAPHAFLYEDHLLRDLGALPGLDHSTATAVNSLGEIVGSSTNGAQTVEGFVYRHGNMISLGIPPGAIGSEATGINNWGDVTGSVILPESFTQAFLYHDGKMINLGTLPGADYSEATAINDSIEITGKSYSSNFQFQHAFLWSKGKMIDLGVLPNSTTSEGSSINRAGQVVGGSGAAFLYSDGKMHNLNDMIPANSGWVLLGATGINDRGQIVGTGELNGVGAAFLLSPDCSDPKNWGCDFCRHER